MNLLALDPGTTETGWAMFVDGKFESAGKDVNEKVLWSLQWPPPDRVVCEMIAAYGMPVGQEVFETCVWIGRFMQAYPEPTRFRRVTRKAVVTHICGSAKAKDANVRQALIDILGKPGTKKKPGPTFGVVGDMWAAIAVGMYGIAKTARVQAKR